MYRELFKTSIKRFDSFMSEATGEDSPLQLPEPVRQVIDDIIAEVDLNALDENAGRALREARRLRIMLTDTLEAAWGPYCGRHRIDEVLTDIFGGGGLERLISICAPRKKPLKSLVWKAG